jgi:hypothetical protein
LIGKFREFPGKIGKKKKKLFGIAGILCGDINNANWWVELGRNRRNEITECKTGGCEKGINIRGRINGKNWAKTSPKETSGRKSGAWKTREHGFESLRKIE